MKRGFTLMELAVVLCIIAILAVLIMPALGWYRERALKVSCTTNLQGLYTSTSSYLGANGFIWPQIPFDSSKIEENTKAWQELLRPYGLNKINWICPSVQAKLGNPNLNDPRALRSDYRAMPFDKKPGTPMKWANQPWFVERQSIHAGGNLIVVSNGTVMTLSDAMRLGKQPQNP